MIIYPSPFICNQVCLTIFSCLFLIDFQIDDQKMKEIALSPWIFSEIKGNNPDDWPQGLNEFHEAVLNLKPLSLFHEPVELLHRDFY